MIWQWYSTSWSKIQSWSHDKVTSISLKQWRLCSSYFQKDGSRSCCVRFTPFAILLERGTRDLGSATAQKMKFSIKNFFSKCDQIRSFLGIWSHLLKNPWWKTYFFVQCKRFLVQTQFINQPVLGTQLEMWFPSILGSQLNNGYIKSDERGRSSVIARPLGSQIIGRERKFYQSRYQVWFLVI